LRTAQYETRTLGGVRGAPWALLLTAVYSIVFSCFIFFFRFSALGKTHSLTSFGLCGCLERLGNVCGFEALAFLSVYIVFNFNCFKYSLCSLVLISIRSLIEVSFSFTSPKSICTSSSAVLTYLEMFRL
jgi:hypothetical protein